MFQGAQRYSDPMTRRQKAQDQIVRVSLLEVGTNEPITTNLLGQMNVMVFSM